MRIGVISDTHIPDRANRIPEKILEDFKEVALILHAGDLVELKALDALRKACARVVAVYGNMDPWEVKDALAEKEVVTAGNKRIGLTHGFGNPRRMIDEIGALFKNDRVEAIVFGHSHCPVNEFRKGILYFNPGSATDKIFSPFNSYGILEVENDKIEGRIIRI